MRLTTAVCVLGLSYAVGVSGLVSAQTTPEAPAAAVAEMPAQETETPEQREFMRALLEAHTPPGFEPPAPAPVIEQPAAVALEAPTPAPPPTPPVLPATPIPPTAAPARGLASEDGETAPELSAKDELGPRLVLRITLGVSAALWIDGDEAELFRPASFSLMAGYAFDDHWAAVVRASTWLKTSDLANEYLGAGTLYRFAGDMSVAATLGLAITRSGTPSDWQHRVQGFAAQIDIGQSWQVGSVLELIVGAHFQIGTPLAGEEPDNFTSFETGIFLGLGLL
ncbi:MAG: hypothetical protein RL701_6954 [Pseudomonadota bacterium]